MFRWTVHRETIDENLVNSPWKVLISTFVFLKIYFMYNVIIKKWRENNDELYSQVLERIWKEGDSWGGYLLC